MSPIIAAAHALAFHCGQRQEGGPDCIDKLITDLTAALQEAEEAGDGARADRIDTVIDILAQRAAAHKRQANQGFHTATLERAMAEIRVYDRRKQGVPKESGTPRKIAPQAAASGSK